MDLKVFLIAFFLAGIIFSAIVVIFWNKFVEKCIKIYHFINYSYSRIQLFGPIFSELANLVVEGKWEKIKVIFEYFFKKNKS